jgi:hypothetical protein
MSVLTGHSGHMQVFSNEMHMKLFPRVQNSFSFAFFAQLLYVGQPGQAHFDFRSSTAFIRSWDDILAIASIFSLNVSIDNSSLGICTDVPSTYISFCGLCGHPLVQCPRSTISHHSDEEMEDSHILRHWSYQDTGFKSIK